MCTSHMQCPQKPEEGIRSPRTGVKTVGSHSEGSGNPLQGLRSSQCSSSPRAPPVRLVTFQTRSHKVPQVDLELTLAPNFPASAF